MIYRPKDSILMLQFLLFNHSNSDILHRDDNPLMGYKIRIIHVRKRYCTWSKLFIPQNNHVGATNIAPACGASIATESC